MKVMLTMHLMKEIRKEEQQIYKLKDSPIKPEDIVSIHFGYNDFSNYTILIKI